MFTGTVVNQAILSRFSLTVIHPAKLSRILLLMRERSCNKQVQQNQHLAQGQDYATTRTSIPSGGKHAISAKRGKTCSPWKARENVKSVLRAGKFEIGTWRRKACNRRQARENMQPVPSAGKRATGTTVVRSEREHLPLPNVTVREYATVSHKRENRNVKWVTSSTKKRLNGTTHGQNE